jgi:hypothetical protein
MFVLACDHSEILHRPVEIPAVNDSTAGKVAPFARKTADRDFVIEYNGMVI